MFFPPSWSALEAEVTAVEGNSQAKSSSRSSSPHGGLKSFLRPVRCGARLVVVVVVCGRGGGRGVVVGVVKRAIRTPCRLEVD